MKRLRLALVTLAMLLAMTLPPQTIRAISAAPLVFPPASWRYFSPAAQWSLLHATRQPVQTIPWLGGSTQPLSGYKNVEVNNPSQDGNSPQRTQAETSVATFGSHVVVGFNDTNGFHIQHNHFVGCFSGYAYSSDGGASFTDGGCIPFPPGGVSFGDPAVTVDPTGAFYYGQLTQDAQGNEYISVSRSIDGGKTWSQPVNSSPKVHTGKNGVPYQDKDWLSVGVNPSNHSQFIIYSSWSHFTQTMSIIQLSRSIDGGKTWSAPVDLQNSFGVQGSYTTEDPGTGKVYAVWANFGKGLHLVLEESSSTDGGQTWSKPKVIYSLLLGVNAMVNCGGATQGVIEFTPGDTKHVSLNASFPQAAVDPITHHVYVVDSEKIGNKVNIVLLSSDDGGTTWHSQLVAPTSQPQFQASISVDQHGVHLEYYQVTSSGTYYEAGINGSHAVPPVFGHPFAVTNTTLQPPQTNPQLDPVIIQCWMGDYNQMASNGHTTTYAWTDTRHYTKSGLDIWSATIR